MKTALLATSFGTAVPQALEDILQVERALASQYPSGDFFRAFTSPTVRARWAERGEFIHSLPEALSHLQALQYEQVLLQPTCLIHGEEYHRIQKESAAFRGSFRVLALGKPLLAGTEDLLALAREAVSFSSPEEVLILLGHGTVRSADKTCSALQTVLQLTGSSALVGAVKGCPDLPEVLSRLKADGRRQVLLAPLMLTAGSHALRDMAGSWKNRLEAEGFSVRCRMAGLGRLPGIQALYQKHLRELMEANSP